MTLRYTLICSKQEFFDRYQVRAPKKLEPDYNIAPGNIIPILKPSGNKPIIDQARWGIKLGPTTEIYNARAETLLEKRSFIDLIQQRGYCLIPASGWYVWKNRNGVKIPWYISLKNSGIISFAGLVKKTKTGRESIIITTESEGPLSDLNERMPFVLKKEDEMKYLNGTGVPDLIPIDQGELALHEVSWSINSMEKNDENLILPYSRSDNEVKKIRELNRKQIVIDRKSENINIDELQEGVFIYTDGGARKNPGPAASAFIILDRNRKMIHESALFLGHATNNIAEYTAVISALKQAAGYTPGVIDLYSDSQLVIRQLTGRYSINKPHLAKLVNEVRTLERAFSKVNYHNVPREEKHIRYCDSLCNKVLDESIPK